MKERIRGDIICSDVRRVETGLAYKSRGASKLKKKAENRCPVCGRPLKPGQRVCDECQKVLDANPWLTVVDLM
jgi:predicted amidophosphoribosyltransferase